MCIISHFLIGFYALTIGRNSILVLWTPSKAHSWRAHRPSKEATTLVLLNGPDVTVKWPSNNHIYTHALVLLLALVESYLLQHSVVIAETCGWSRWEWIHNWMPIHKLDICIASSEAQETPLKQGWRERKNWREQKWVEHGLLSMAQPLFSWMLGSCDHLRMTGSANALLWSEEGLKPSPFWDFGRWSMAVGVGLTSSVVKRPHSSKQTGLGAWAGDREESRKG